MRATDNTKMQKPATDVKEKLVVVIEINGKQVNPSSPITMDKKLPDFNWENQREYFEECLYACFGLSRKDVWNEMKADMAAHLASLTSIKELLYFAKGLRWDIGSYTKKELKELAKMIDKRRDQLIKELK